MQPGVGHYGVFNGSRFRSEIAPRIADFILSNEGGRARADKAGARNANAVAPKPNGAAPGAAAAVEAR
jgi:poly(3-hydroxybutyrate) depolymerase